MRRLWQRFQTWRWTTWPIGHDGRPTWRWPKEDA